jgi:hypothetical protein
MTETVTKPGLRGVDFSKSGANGTNEIKRGRKSPKFENV